MLVGAQVGGGGLGVSRLGDGRRLATISPAWAPPATRSPGFRGLLYGLGQRLGKPGTAVGFLLGLFILSAQIPGEELLPDTLKHTGPALLLFFLLPGSTCKEQQMVPAQLSSPAPSEGRRRGFNAPWPKSSRMSAVCLLISRQVSHLAFGRDKSHGFLPERLEKACCRCPAYNRCWDESFLQNYWDLIAILAALEKPGTKMPKTNLEGRCIRRGAFLEAIGGKVLETIRLEEHWRQRLKEARRRSPDS